MKRYRFFVSLWLVSSVLYAQPLVKEGKVEIRKQDIANHTILSLDGDWEFYWEQLLTPPSFTEKAITPIFQYVPKKWQSYSIENINVRGYATYRLIILNRDTLQNLMLKIPGIATASKVWVNGKLVAEAGHISTTKEESHADRSHHFVKLPGEPQIELVVQASNYEYAFPGIAHAVMLGEEMALLDKDRIFSDFEMIEVGFLILMIFYHMALYFQLNRNPSYLLLSALCLIILVRALSTYHSSLLIFRLFEGVNFSFIKTIEFASIYAGIFLLPMFINSLFPLETPRFGLRVFQVLGGLMVLLVLVAPLHISGQSLDAFHVLMTLSFLFVLWVLFRAITKKRLGASIIFAGIIGCFFFVGFEMMTVSGIIPERSNPIPNSVGIGIVFFLFFQAIALSIRFAQAFKDVEELSHSLEKRVEKRTEELSRANLVKDKMFSIISHDLRSPLHSLKGLLELTGSGISPEELQNLLPLVKQNLNNSLQLMDNLLSWASTQMKGLNAVPEKFNLFPLVEENMNLYRSIAKNKNIKLINHIDFKTEVTADPNMAKLIIRNLISNAIKYTPDGGAVEIAMDVNSKETIVSVLDSGVGMDQDFMQHLFEIDSNRTKPGTRNEKGTGIGLLLCKEFVEKNGGKLWAESEIGKGSTFKFTLPN